MAVLALFLLAGLLGIYLKVALLSEHWESVARFFNRAHAADLSLLERLGFFHRDLALNAIFVPLAGAVVVGRVWGRYRTAVALAATVLMILFYFVELRVQSVTGQYLSQDVLGDTVGYGASNPAMGAEYLTAASVIKLVLLLLALAGVVAVARLARKAGQQTARSSGWYDIALRAPVTAGMGIALLLASVSYACRLPDSGLNASAVGRAVATTFGRPGGAASSIPSTFEQALITFRQMTGTAALDVRHPLVGGERESDLIIFMMETGPARALDLTVDGADLPGTGPLWSRALLARQHYTTHPFSSDALYSVLSGLYPQGRRHMLAANGGEQRNGLMTALAPGSSLRRVYVPSLYGLELDRAMYGAFGAELYVADEQPSDPLAAAGERSAEALLAGLERQGQRYDSATRELLRARLAADRQMLERMMADISASVQARRRYSVLVFPEIGHAPWLPLHGEPTVLARGRALMLLQDAWLKEIVDQVRALGRLDRTVIAVTADHGIRTRVEDPALPAGRISDYTFRVPLLVYAPQSLRHTLVVDSPTSHIDIAPTLLALFGETEAAGRMQGVPAWQRSDADRIFFWASAYGGADGFTQGGDYYMRQALSDAVYRGERFSFTIRDQATSRDVVSFVKDALTAAEQFQHALVARSLAQPARARSPSPPRLLSEDAAAPTGPTPGR